MLGLVGWTLAKVRRERAQLSKEEDKLVQASQELRRPPWKASRPRSSARTTRWTRHIKPSASEPAIVNSLGERNQSPTALPASTPTEREMTKLRYAALAEAVRQLIGSHHIRS